jgi:hypothetical protein
MNEFNVCVVVEACYEHQRSMGQLMWHDTGAGITVFFIFCLAMPWLMHLLSDGICYMISYA